MGLKPNHIENQKQAAEKALSARQDQLRAKGLDDRAINRDPLVKKTKAAIRQGVRRQARVTALDKQNAERAQFKADKAAGKTAKAEGKPAKAEGKPAKDEGSKKKEKKSKSEHKETEA